MPSPVSTWDARPSAARAGLRNLIGLLKVAIAELTEAQEPEQRLSAIVRKFAAAERDLTACRGEDDRLLGAWLAGGAEGGRPQPSERTLVAERALDALSFDAIAARAALPDHQSRVQVCAERVRELDIARRDAAYRVAIEAVREFLEAEFRPALRRLLAIEATTRSVEQALSELGNGANPSTVALGCSVDVATAIREAKAGVGVTRDRETGKRLIDHLMHNAAAALGETGGAAAADPSQLLSATPA